MSPTPMSLPSERRGRAASDDLIARRAFLETLADNFPPFEGVTQTEEQIGTVRVLRFRPSGQAMATMIYLHGGGFRLCAPDHYVGFASFLAASAGIEVISPDYRLAPEHPFPAAISDALAVFEGISEEAKARLVLAGDSAGGGLTASLTQLAVSRGCTPLGVILFSPWLDLRVARPSFDENGEHDPLFSKASALEGSEQYLQGHAPEDPLASPVFGEVGNFPPTLISVGEHEVLRDDSLAFAQKLKGAGVDVELVCTPHMQHVACTRDPKLEGAAESTAATLAFLSRILA